MNADTNIVYAICADNQDPWGVGRIRVVFDQDFSPPVRTAVNVENYLKKLDQVNTETNGAGAYIPWELGVDGRSPDPYVISPFLPKHLNIIPKVGESIKIVYYQTGTDTAQREYIGPHTSNYDHLYMEPVESGRSFTTKATVTPKKESYRPPYQTDGLVANVEDVGVFGRRNSEIVFPDNESFIRTGHQNFLSKQKNTRAALFQSSYYFTRKNLTTETVDVDNSEAKPIGYIMEYQTDIFDKTKVPSYIQTTVYIYPVIDVNTYNYNPYKIYLVNTEDAEFVFTVSSSNTGNISSFIKTFLQKMNNGFSLETITVDGSIQTEIPVTKNNTTYNVIVDNRVSTTGAALDNTYALGLYQFRPAPTNDLSITEAQEIVNALQPALSPPSMAPTKQLTQEEKDVTSVDGSSDESVMVEGADKIFLLSWRNPQQIQNKIGTYGFSQDEIYLTLQKYTEPMVKGETLRQMIVDIIDLIQQHSHVGVNPGDIDQTGTSLIDNIRTKYELTKPVSSDLSGGSTFLNQYLRLN